MSDVFGSRDGAYPAVIPYLLVPEAAAVIDFMERGFGARRRFSKASESGGVLHAEIALGDGVVMISDAAEAGGTSHLCHYVADADAVYERALAAGGQSVSAPETKDHGDREAGVKDPAGNTWWICQRGV